MESESIVYLEDIETKKVTKAGLSAEGSLNAKPDAVAAKSSKPDNIAEAGNKRQRNLMDMFSSGSQPSTSSGSTAKRLKLTTSNPTLPARMTQSRGLRLNAIPFSLSQFQESLSEEQRGLLALECAYMGKSWYAIAMPIPLCTNILH